MRAARRGNWEAVSAASFIVFAKDSSASPPPRSALRVREAVAAAPSALPRTYVKTLAAARSASGPLKPAFS